MVTIMLSKANSHELPLPYMLSWMYERTHSLGWLFPVSLSTTSDFTMCGFACSHRCCDQDFL